MWCPRGSVGAGKNRTPGFTQGRGGENRTVTGRDEGEESGFKRLLEAEYRWERSAWVRSRSCVDFVETKSCTEPGLQFQRKTPVSLKLRVESDG